MNEDPESNLDNQVTVIVLDELKNETNAVFELLNKTAERNSASAKYAVVKLNRHDASLDAQIKQSDAVIVALSASSEANSEWLKNTVPYTEHIPVIVVADSENPNIVSSAKQLHANEVIPKENLTAPILLKLIDNALERQRLILELERRNRELERNQQRLKAILEHTANGVIIVDMNGIIKFANKSAIEILGRSSDELIGQSFGFPIVTHETTEIDILHKDGDLTIAEMRVVEMGLHGEAAFVVSLFDITEHVKFQSELCEMSMMDELTGLLNRRGFFSMTKHMFNKSSCRKNAILVYIDLDGLKIINDTYGHGYGDKAIMVVANALKNTFRSEDVIARLGGDEFAVAAIKNHPIDNEKLEARLIVELQKEAEIAALPFPVSISIGFTVCSEICGDEKKCSVDDMILIADKRMYKKKKRMQIDIRSSPE